MLLPGEIVVDNFAGGGGASTGMELGLQRPVDIAINHDPDAIDMHKQNHPEAKHYCESVWDVDPVEACDGKPVGLAWFSPDCKHFSKAKGRAPVDKNIRGLAWVLINWLAQVPVRIFMLENVEEFLTWGPVVDGKPCNERKGETFEGFILSLTTGLPVEHPAYKDVYHALFRCNYDIQTKLKIFRAIKHGLGYQVDWKILSACDYGAPTVRKRLFLVGRNDGVDITWPTPTHGKTEGLAPFKTAADIIDWSIPVKSIFNRKKPLAENTLKRIAKGLEKFVLNGDPFIAPEECAVPFVTEHANSSSQRNIPLDEPLRSICAQVKGGQFDLVAPIIDRQFGKSECNSVTEPLGTITAGGQGKSALVSVYIAKHYTGVSGSDISEPLHTVTQEDHNALVATHMVKMRGTNIGHGADEPVHTNSAGGFHVGEVRALMIKHYGTNYEDKCSESLQAFTKHRLGVVTVSGVDYQIVDIGMRMLEPHELFAAQGFPEDYKISHDSNGNKLSKAKQVARCGNAVCPPIAQALVEVNIGKFKEEAAA